MVACVHFNNFQSILKFTNFNIPELWNRCQNLRGSRGLAVLTSIYPGSFCRLFKHVSSAWDLSPDKFVILQSRTFRSGYWRSLIKILWPEINSLQVSYKQLGSIFMMLQFYTNSIFFTAVDLEKFIMRFIKKHWFDLFHDLNFCSESH